MVLIDCFSELYPALGLQCHFVVALIDLKRIFLNIIEILYLAHVGAGVANCWWVPESSAKGKAWLMLVEFWVN